ncbi:MAG: hypothetical protein ABSH44_03720 [Bryobacteraceae bacterium]|jgi:hypothetical protein
MFLLLAASVATAVDNEFTRKSLKGLKGVNVLVEPLEAEVEQGGLTKTSIQTDVELRLRQAGITVLTDAENLAAPGSPYLYIVVLTFRGPQYNYSIGVELCQSVRLERDPSIQIFGATTWSVAGIGGVSRNNPRAIRDDIKDYVDMFINAYLSVNPKK